MYNYSYTQDEVKAILTCYLDISEHTDIDSVRDRLIDFDLAFNKLPEKERVAIYHHYILGLSYKETSKKLKLPISTVSSRCNTGLSRLLDTMNGDYVKP